MSGDSNKSNTDVFGMQRTSEAVFPRQGRKDLRILSLIWQHHVQENGDVRKAAHIRIKSLKDGSRKYGWRIPHNSCDERELVGITVTVGGQLVAVQKELRREEEQVLTVINFDLGTLARNQEVTITIEYHQNAYARRTRRGLLGTQWQYDWVYNILTPTEHFENWVYLPKSAKRVLDSARSTLSTHSRICEDEGRIIHVTEVDNPGPGGKMGELPYFAPSHAIPATIYFLATLALAIPIAFLNKFGVTGAIVTGCGILATAFLVHWLVDKLQ